MWWLIHNNNKHRFIPAPCFEISVCQPVNQSVLWFVVFCSLGCPGPSDSTDTSLRGVGSHHLTFYPSGLHRNLSHIVTLAFDLHIRTHTQIFEHTNMYAVKTYGPFLITEETLMKLSINYDIVHDFRRESILWLLRCMAKLWNENGVGHWICVCVCAALCVYQHVHVYAFVSQWVMVFWPDNCNATWIPEPDFSIEKLEGSHVPPVAVVCTNRQSCPWVFLFHRMSK